MMKMIGPKVYRRYLGEVGDVPIPKNFIEAGNRLEPFEKKTLLREYFQLLFVPAFITIKTTSLALNNGRLVEHLGEKRELQVPVTLKNIVKLFETGLRKGTPIEVSQEWADIFGQIGDEPVRQSHWSCQAVGVICRAWRYESQQNIAAQHGFKIAPLIHRILWELLTQVGKPWPALVDRYTVMRTSTLIKDKYGHERPVTLSWEDGRSVCLVLRFGGDPSFLVGVAVELPVEE